MWSGYRPHSLFYGVRVSQYLHSEAAVRIFNEKQKAAPNLAEYGICGMPRQTCFSSGSVFQATS
ncbi:hypothetical protein CS542_10220 [Pedobacter sp. IW39]|nr:hypothetical protein CS542_10220 [Pedobacter sp. IW39]